MKLYWIAFGCALAVVVGGCGGAEKSDCRDGDDNDGDGFIDQVDPGCTLGEGLLESPDPPPAICNNDDDDDGDGFLDYPEDPGCEDELDYDETDPPPAPKLCNNGDDDDGDGERDYPYDPGCTGLDDDDEADPDTAPACANDTDDDADDKTDYPSDPGCRSASDDTEADPVLGVCGPGSVVDVFPGGSIQGVIGAEPGPNNLQGKCGGLGKEAIYSFTLPEPRYLIVSTDHPETTLDTVLYVRGACTDQETELGCVDDQTQKKTGTLTLPRVEAGDYYIIVDSFGPGSAGDFKVSVTEFVAAGEPCDAAAMPSVCAPGYFCRLSTVDSTETTCELAACKDGIDNDNDSKADYPEEPGCDSPDDTDEADPAVAPQCSNDDDDDNDGLTDWNADPMVGDPGCDAASDNNEIDECVPGKQLVALPDAGLSGTTVGAGSHFTASCSSSTSSAQDVVHIYDQTRDLASLSFSTVGSTIDTALYVRFEDCAGSPDVVCAEQFGQETVSIPNPQIGPYFVFVDGSFSSVQGNYTLNVSGVVKENGACTPGSSKFVCTTGTVCRAGLNVCEATACNDGDDNDGDMKADDADPGCVSIIDDDETDPAVLPECADGDDNDMNGSMDYPGDPGCERAGDDLELECSDSDAITDISHAQTTNGTTSGFTNDFTPSCATFSLGPDVLYTFRVPGELATLVLDTNNSALDTVLMLKDSCAMGSVDIACDDDAGDPGLQSKITRTNVAPGTYFIVVDSYSSSVGGFALHITGSIKANQPCDPLQVVPGFLTCATGTCKDKSDGMGFRCQL